MKTLILVGNFSENDGGWRGTGLPTCRSVEDGWYAHLVKYVCLLFGLKLQETWAVPRVWGVCGHRASRAAQALPDALAFSAESSRPPPPPVPSSDRVLRESRGRREARPREAGGRPLPRPVHEADAAVSAVRPASLDGVQQAVSSEFKAPKQSRFQNFEN